MQSPAEQGLTQCWWGWSLDAFIPPLSSGYQASWAAPGLHSLQPPMMNWRDHTIHWGTWSPYQKSMSGRVSIQALQLLWRISNQIEQPFSLASQRPCLLEATQFHQQWFHIPRSQHRSPTFAVLFAFETLNSSRSPSWSNFRKCSENSEICLFSLASPVRFQIQPPSPLLTPPGVIHGSCEHQAEAARWLTAASSWLSHLPAASSVGPDCCWTVWFAHI
jgi:hypothetical protein